MQDLVTIKARLPQALMKKVERVAAFDGCRRNRFIIKALESYLREDGPAAIETEARRQSKLARKLDMPETPWDEMAESDLLRQ